MCAAFLPAALAAAVFRAYPQQRTSLADEVLTVVGNLQVSGSKAPSRLFEATGPGLEPLPVMMATALIAQLVQVGSNSSSRKPRWCFRGVGLE